ncbi:SixA phosphatase family protein [Hyphomonas sp.]|jgi:probable phosphoglycerate mutase|uniref:SixA phosphatase family protein n=1 Tax=Hyphomonas sp. TaxID=87 RepID=UPI0039E3D47A
MSLSRRSLFGFVAALMILAACSVHPAPEHTIYLVRHAEKQAGDGPSLTPAGAMRADLLAETLRDTRIVRIYSTDYARTRETAAPIARAVSVSVTLYDPSDLSAFASQLKAESGIVLVVGHSNTTPALVDFLGGEPGTDIDEPAEYDRLYVVSIRGDRVETELRRYGAPYQP